MFDEGVLGELYKLFESNIIYLILFFCAIIYVFIKQNKKTKFVMIVVALASVLLIFNDISYEILTKVYGSYYRFFWLWSVPIVIGIVFVEILYKFKNTYFRYTILCVSMLLLLLVSRTHISSLDSLMPKDNIYGISNDIIQLDDIISEDTNDEYITLLCDITTAYVVREYDAKYILPLGIRQHIGVDNIRNKSSYKETDKTYLAKAVQYNENIDINYYSELCRKYDIHYISIYADYDIVIDTFDNSSFELIGKTDNYYVYRVDS